LDLILHLDAPRVCAHHSHLVADPAPAGCDDLALLYRLRHLYRLAAPAYPRLFIYPVYRAGPYHDGVITSAYSNTVSTFYFAKWMRNIDEILVSPTPDWVVIAGFVSGRFLRGLLVGILVLIVSLFFTHIVIANIFVLIAALILTSVFFSFAGLINGIYAKGFDGVSIVPTFVLTPLTYLGGIFYSISNSRFWQKVSLANPILYMVNAFRYGFLGVSDVSLWTCFSVLIGFTIAFAAVSIYLFKKGTGIKN
jgi:ABC-2 type transport system permease protein